MEQVMSIKPMSGYRLEVEYQGGRRSVLNLKARLFAAVVETLRDMSLISKDVVDEFGVIDTSHGADNSSEVA